MSSGYITQLKSVNPVLPPGPGDDTLLCSKHPVSVLSSWRLSQKLKFTSFEKRSALAF